jgi:LmbE family N-acetylglucosaminyl deacetylase
MITPAIRHDKEKKQMDTSYNNWIYLSPHFDDAAYSCGGLIWEQVHAGMKVEIWTICAGSIPDRPLSPFARELHSRWNTGPEAVSARFEEDRRACHRLGAESRYMDIPDCIYRFRKLADGEQPLIQGESDLTGTNPEEDLIAELAARLASELPPKTTVVSPVALGSHVDHLLTRAAAEASGYPLYYYPDYPYVLRCPNELAELECGVWKRISAPVSSAGLAAWQDAVVSYQSQINTFWSSADEAALSVKNYWGGGRLWVRLDSNPKKLAIKKKI